MRTLGSARPVFGHRTLFVVLAVALSATGLVGPGRLSRARALDGYTTTRLTVNSAGEQFNIDSEMPALSPDGRLIAFRSYADNVLGPDTPWCQVWLNDGTPGSFELISADNSGTAGDDCSRPSAISADGRYVVFQSYSSNLTPEGGDTFWERLYLRDRVNQTTTLVAGTLAAAWTAGKGSTWGGTITADNRYIAFASYSDDIIPNDTNGRGDIFVKDLQTGTVTRLTQGIGGTGGNDSSGVPTITPDGRYVVFESDASNLVAGDTNNSSDIFRMDLTTGTTVLVSTSAAGVQGNSYSALWINSISNDGTLVAFQSDAGNLVAYDTNTTQDVFVKNLTTGAVDLVSSDSNWNAGDYWSYAATMARGGRYVGFASHADNLVPNDTNNERDIFVKDLYTGETKRINVSTDGDEANDGSDETLLSDDGSIGAYTSDANTLANGDTGWTKDIFVWAPEGTYIAREPAELFGFRWSSAYANDPVNTATGNFVDAHTDLDFPGSVFGLTWQRTYNSRDNRVGVLGTGWSPDFAESLTANGDGSVTMRDTDGRKLTFHPNGSGGFDRPEEFFGTLAANGDGTHTVSYFQGSTATFGADGRLAQRQNWDGQTVTFTWSADKLVNAASSSGYSLAFSYNSSTGRLATVAASDGRSVSYGYDLNGNLVSFTDAAGGVTHYASNAAGRITGVTDADGKPVITNAYDSRGRVIHQDTPSGNAVIFDYDDQAGITTVTDTSTSSATVFTHDQQGRVISVSDPAGETLAKTYDGAGNVATVTDRKGGVTTTTYDAHGNVLTRSEPGGVNTSMAYDGQDRLTSTTDGTGATTTFEYGGSIRIPNGVHDPESGITAIQQSGGLVTKVVDPDGVTTHFAYDSARNLTTVTDGLNKTTAFGYDARGNQTSVTTPLSAHATAVYDAVRRLTDTTDPVGATIHISYTAAGRVSARSGTSTTAESYAYDAAGRLATVTDAAANATSLAYDADNNLTSLTRPGGSVTTLAYDAMGRLLSQTDPMGITASFGYDADGRRTSVTTPAGTTTQTLDSRGRATSIKDALNRETTLTYDLADRVKTVTSPMGSVVSYTYDDNGRVTGVRSPEGGDSIMAYTLGGRPWTRYDELGRQLEYFTYDAAGHVRTVTDALSKDTAYGYDDDGRLKTITSPTGLVTTYGYDAAGRVTSVQDAAGGKVTRTYNARGQVATSFDNTGVGSTYTYDSRGLLTQATNALNHTTKYEYDARGNLTKRTDARNRAETWQYDLADRLTVYKDKGTSLTQLTYDAAGRLKTVTDPTGRKATYAYDPVGQVLSKAYADGTSISYADDADGRRAGMTDPTGTTTYDHDDSGNVTGVHFPGNRSVFYEYNLADERTSLTYPDGSTAAYGYDPQGRLASVSHAGASVGYGYDDDGRLIHETLPAGSRDYGYTLGRLTSYTESLAGVPRTTQLGYDAMGRVASTTTAGVTRTFTYNKGGLLVSAQGPAVPNGAALTAYAYDSVGNRRTVTRGLATSTTTIDTRDRVTSVAEPVGTTNYTYDAASRRTGQVGPNLSITTAYNGRGLPATQTATAVPTLGGGVTATAHRQFDGDGNLTAVTATSGGASASRTLTWDIASPVPQVLAVQDGPGPQTDIVYGLGRELAVRPALGVASAFSRDALGSNVATAGTAGLVRATGYDDFGQPAPEAAGASTISGSQAVAAATSLTAQLPTFGYRGELHTGAEQYLRARQLDPANGIFTSRDPLGTPPGEDSTTHRFAYAANDPLNHIDPLGLSPWGDSSYWSMLAHWDLAVWQAKQAVREQMAAAQQLMETARLLHLQAKYFFMRQLDAFHQMGDQSGIRLNDVIESFNDATRGQLPYVTVGLRQLDHILGVVHEEGVWNGLSMTLNPAYGMVAAYNSLWNALYDGRWEDAGRAALELSVASANTVLFATGVAAAGGALLSRLSAVEGSLPLLFRSAVPIEGTAGAPLEASLETVHSVASQAGADLGGLRVQIVDDADLVGRQLYGHTAPDGTITLYPDAFANAETLAATLGHELNHVYQLSVFGPAMDSVMINAYEKASYAVEESYLSHYRAYG